MEIVYIVRMNNAHLTSKLLTTIWPLHQHLNFGEANQVAHVAAVAADDKAHELTKAKFAALGRTPKAKPAFDFDNVRLQAITCGILVENVGQCLYGTHHAVVNGRTLCGQSGAPRERRTTMWFNLESISEESAREYITCNRCRKSMGFDKVRESKVML